MAAPQLMVGPLLRYVGQHDATVWVETDQPCEVRGPRPPCPHLRGVRPPLRAGRHRGPRAGDQPPVRGRARRPHGLARHRRGDVPAASIRARSGDDLTCASPSGRAACLSARAAVLAAQGRQQARPRGRRALRLALRMRDEAADRWPDLLLWLGDQVYADEISPGVREFIRCAATTHTAARRRGRRLRGVRAAVLGVVAGHGDPVAARRRVPTAMIFDDHDVHDDWNTSGLGGHDPAQALVARADRRRLHVLLGLPAPREPLAGRAPGGRDLAPRRAGRGRYRARCARWRSAPSTAPPARASPTHATSGARALIVMDSRAGAGARRDTGDGRRRSSGNGSSTRPPATSTTCCSGPRCPTCSPPRSTISRRGTRRCAAAPGAARPRSSASACVRGSTSSTGPRSTARSAS